MSEARQSLSIMPRTGPADNCGIGCPYRFSFGAKGKQRKGKNRRFGSVLCRQSGSPEVALSHPQLSVIGISQQIGIESTSQYYRGRVGEAGKLALKPD